MTTTNDKATEIKAGDVYRHRGGFGVDSSAQTVASVDADMVRWTDGTVTPRWIFADLLKHGHYTAAR